MTSQLLITVCMLVVCCFMQHSEATSVPDHPCLIVDGVVAESWEECDGICCTSHCRCIEDENGQPQSLCMTACPGILLPEGCTALEPTYSGTKATCCRYECDGEVMEYK